MKMEWIKSIKKHAFFCFCVFCIIFLKNNDLKCSASFIKKETKTSLTEEQKILTTSDNETEKDMEEELISLWNDRYMDKFFSDFQKETFVFPEENGSNAAFHAKDLWESIMKGDVISGVKGLWNYVIENGIAKYSEYLEIGYWILFFSIVSSLYVVLTDVLKNQQVAQMGEYVLYMLCTIKLISCFQLLYEDSLRVLNQLTLFVKLLLPAYAAVLGMTNGIRSATIYYEGILAIIWLIENILSKFILPSIQIYMIFIVLGGIWKDDRMLLLQKTMKKVIGWILRLMMWILGSIGVLQSLITPVIDSLEWKSMKRIVGMIPGVGNISEGISEILLGSAVLIRNGTGVFFTIMILFLCAIPIFKLCFISVSVKLVAGISNMISHNRVSVIADRASDAFFLLCKVLFTGIGLFLMSVAITLFAAGRSGF